jgi:aminopeptidase N
MLPYVTAHEIAHQWWYAVVGNDVLAHPWQDEALATYSAQLYMEKHNPVFYQGALSLYRERVADLEAEQGVQPIDQSVAELADSPNAYSTIAYLKGDLFFEALREEIGVSAMNAGLQAYYQDFSYRITPPAGLLDSFETACQCELDALYSHWGVQP